MRPDKGRARDYPSPGLQTTTASTRQVTGKVSVHGGVVDLDLGLAAFELAAAFPTAEADLPLKPPAAAGWWAGRVWGRTEGWACAALGVGGHYTDSGRYEFTDFHHRYYRWPDHTRRFLVELLRAAPEADVYVIPLLRRDRSARKGAAAAGQVAWADVDGAWTPERAAATDRLRAGGPPVWLVESGSGGRHVYTRLAEAAPPDQVEAWNRRLGALLGADHKWAENSLLRLPGTLNHKPHKSRKAPTVVRWTR
jgi:hypothetical protein